MKSICWQSGVFVSMLFAFSWTTGCGRSDLLAGPDDEPVNVGGATSTVASSAGGRSSVAISSSQGQAGAGGNGGAANSSTIASKPSGGSGGFGGNGGSSPLSTSSTKPLAGAIGGAGGVSALAGSKTSGGAGAIGGAGGVSALAGSKTSGGAGAIGGASATGGSVVRCSDAKGCGGDVVGTWNVTSSCLSATGQVDLSMLALGCKSVSIDESVTVTGTWVAMADGSYSDKTTTKGSVQFAVPASCLRLAGTTVSCSVVAPVFEALGYASMTCKDATGGGCTCATAVNQVGGLGVISDSPSTGGVYKASGNVLTFDGTSRYAYCVSGTQLTLSPQGTNPPATGSIVFQKQ